MTTFNNYFIWLFHQRDQGNNIADLACDAFADKKWKGTMKGLKQRLIEEPATSPLTMDAYEQSVILYRDQRKKY